MKTCTKCKLSKAVALFGVCSRNKDGLDTLCKSCYNTRKRKWHLTDSGVKAYNKARARAAEKKIKAIEYKGGKCNDCGGVFHPAVYEFHHISPNEKEAEPATLRNYSWEKLKKEIDKCVMLCANCHRIRHYSVS